MCDVNLREIKMGDVLISRAQETWKSLCYYTLMHTFTRGNVDTYLKAENILFIDSAGIILY